MGYPGAVKRRVRFATRIGLGIALSLAVTGCPREVQDPSPGDGPPCDVLADCNGGSSCGEEPLRACVDSLCEQTPSLVRPCSALPDAGP